jgi:hypothetical protein
MSMEPSEAVPDLVGRTSARLLANGVPRRERLAALHLLALLDASTDAQGAVRRPLDDLAAEFELHPLDALRSMELLESAGAVARLDGGWVQLLGRTNDGLGGMQLADFLDDVRASFDGGGGTVVGLAPRRTRVLTRVGAGLLAVAAAASVVVLAPSTAPSPVRPLSAAAPTTVPHGPVSTTTPVAGASSTPTAARADEAPVSTTAPLLPDTAVLAADACPTEEPTAQVIGDILRVTNPSTEDVIVHTIGVGGQELAVPLEVDAGGTAIERLATPALGSVDAEIVSWEWTDPEVARTCQA